LEAVLAFFIGTAFNTSNNVVRKKENEIRQIPKQELFLHKDDTRKEALYYGKHKNISQSGTAWIFS
jgi:hypothetical protein